MANNRRIFLALTVSREIKDRLKVWRASQKSILQEIDWLRDSDLHMTLVRPWHVDAIGLKNAYKTLLVYPSRKRFGIKLETIESGPDKKTPRLIWAKASLSTALLNLNSDMEKLFGVKSEFKKFLPHITIGYFKDKRESPGKALVLNRKIGWRFDAEKIVIMESLKVRTGGRYKILKVLKLK